MSATGEGGMTAESPSGWTVDTLRADVLGRLGELDKRYEQRFDAQEKAVITALRSAQEAVSKAETATEKRFEGVNEFRSSLSDLTATMMPRAESTARWSALAERVDKLEKAFAADSGRNKGLSDGWGYVVGAIGAIGAVVAIILAFNN